MSGIHRVTERVIATSTLTNLQGSLSKMQLLQGQLSSGKLIQKPSDDPSGAVNAMQYRADIKRSQQYARNAQDGLGWLGMADNTLTASLESIQRVRELVLSGANATADPEARAALAQEIKTTKEGLINLANTAYNNRPIFSGTADPAGQVPPVETYQPDGTYNGNTAAIHRTVGPNASVQVNLDGPSVFGAPGRNDLWHILDDIQAHLESTDPVENAKLTQGWTDPVDGALAGDLDRLDAARLNIQNRLSEVGARYHRVETMQSRAETNLLNYENELSETENIDLPKTIVALQLQSAAYQAALSATAKVIQPSLVDFIN